MAKGKVRQLRNVLKLIHPDMFHDQETCQKTNERSLQYLMQYFEALEHPYSTLPDFPSALRFFYRRGDGAIHELRFSLDTPSGFLSSAERSGLAGSCIRRLSAALGLEDGNDSQENDDADEAIHFEIRHVLSEFLALSRLRKAEYERLERECDLAEQALKKQLNIKVFVSVAMSRVAALPTLKRMVAWHEELRDAGISGHYVTIGGDYSWKSEDRLEIPPDFNLEAAVSLIRGKPLARGFPAEPEWWRIKDNLVDRLRKMYRIRWIGEDIFIPPEDVIAGIRKLEKCNPELRRFDLSGMSFLIGDTYRLTSHGSMVIPADLCCPDLVAFLETSLDQARTFSRESDALDALVAAKQEMFRGRTGAKIRKGIFVSATDFASAVDRLLDALEGEVRLPVRGHAFSITDRYEVDGDGTISLQHDFSVSDLTSLLLPASCTALCAGET